MPVINLYRLHLSSPKTILKCLANYFQLDKNFPAINSYEIHEDVIIPLKCSLVYKFDFFFFHSYKFGTWLFFMIKNDVFVFRKPLRYETVQTKTRCQCWMAFTWISVAMMCCPPLLGFQKPIFDREAFVCMLDWGNMAAYTITLGILVLGPSVITIFYTYFYIFSMMKKLRSGEPIHDKEYATALSENLSNPSHIMSFVLVTTFWISWTPYAGLRIWSALNGPPQVNLIIPNFKNSYKVCWVNSFLTILETVKFYYFSFERKKFHLKYSFHFKLNALLNTVLHEYLLTWRYTGTLPHDRDIKINSLRIMRTS